MGSGGWGKRRVGCVGDAEAGCVFCYFGRVGEVVFWILGVREADFDAIVEDCGGTFGGEGGGYGIVQVEICLGGHLEDKEYA